MCYSVVLISQCVRLLYCIVVLSRYMCYSVVWISQCVSCVVLYCSAIMLHVLQCCVDIAVCQSVVLYCSAAVLCGYRSVSVCCIVL